MPPASAASLACVVTSVREASSACARVSVETVAAPASERASSTLLLVALVTVVVVADEERECVGSRWELESSGEALHSFSAAAHQRTVVANEGLGRVH